MIEAWTKCPALRPFFPYFGSKFRLAGKYPAPEYQTIIEPFAGSACYSLRYHRKEVLLFDLNKQVVGAWKELISGGVYGLPDMKKGDSIPDMPSDLMKMCASIGSGDGAVLSATARAVEDWMASDKSPSQHNGRRNGYRQRAERYADAISHWDVTLLDYRDIGNTSATWFIDPPYQHQGGGGAYLHGSEGINYDELAKWCKTRRGQVIVCEREGADWLPFRPLAEHRGMNNKKATEVIWIND